MKPSVQKLGIRLIAAALPLAAVGAEGDDRREATDKPSFSELDTDRDGLLSEKELQQAGGAIDTSRLAAKWPELDRDRDGHLDPSEFARMEVVFGRALDYRKHTETIER